MNESGALDAVKLALAKLPGRVHGNLKFEFLRVGDDGFLSLVFGSQQFVGSLFVRIDSHEFVR